MTTATHQKHPYRAVETTQNHIEASALLKWLEIAGYTARISRSVTYPGCWEVQAVGEARTLNAEVAGWWSDWTDR